MRKDSEIPATDVLRWYGSPWRGLTAGEHGKCRKVAFIRPDGHGAGDFDEFAAKATGRFIIDARYG